LIQLVFNCQLLNYPSLSRAKWQRRLSLLHGRPSPDEEAAVQVGAQGPQEPRVADVGVDSDGARLLPRLPAAGQDPECAVPGERQVRDNGPRRAPLHSHSPDVRALVQADHL